MWRTEGLVVERFAEVRGCNESRVAGPRRRERGRDGDGEEGGGERERAA